MNDLVTWLRAQLDHDELCARDVNPTPPVGASIVLVGDVETRHVVAYDPARVLRQVTAHREIVDWCVEVIGERDMTRYGQLGTLKDDPESLAVTLAAETLLYLASIYADQPGYRNEWAPDQPTHGDPA